MWHKANVQADGWNLEKFAEIGDPLEFCETGCSCFWIDEPDGALHRRDIGIAFTLETGEQAADADPRFAELAR